jgi:glycosyltransferase involved in cell wall biosynthesis
LAAGISAHHSGARLTVLTLDGGMPTDPLLEWISPDEPGIGPLDPLFASNRRADAIEWLKPRLLGHLLTTGEEMAIYVDAGVHVTAPLTPVFDSLQRSGMVVVPRAVQPPPNDTLRPDAADLRRAGRLGSTLIGATSWAVGSRFVHWWIARLDDAVSFSRTSCEAPRLADRALTRWLDIAPARHPEIHVLEDRGCGFGWWNAHERVLEFDRDRFLVDGRPLRFAHFDGFDPVRPYLLGPSGGRVRTSDSPALATLSESYLQQLIEAGWTDPRRRDAVGRSLPGGELFDDRLSHLLAAAHAAGCRFDPFDPQGHEQFFEWLRGPAPQGAHAGVNRFLWQLYCEREDLPQAYPDLDGADGADFVDWAWVFGREQMGIPERLLPSRPPAIPAAAHDGRNHFRLPALPRGPKPDMSVNVTGLFRGTLGLGEAARGYVHALEAAQVSVSTTTVEVGQFVAESGGPHAGYGQVEYKERRGDGSAGFNLICINADELGAFADNVGEHFFAQRPSIGVWAWETDHVPARWERAFHLLDEIWVYSTYVAENLSQAAPIPVKRVPPPVSAPAPCDVSLDLDVPSGFLFLFMFDFFSTTARKNPVGLVHAFREAFDPDEGPQLVIKTINGVHRTAELEELLWAARGRSDVHVVDRSLNARERDALVASCDCYVSLHRSEGFGLTIAECMALGKPVIVTAYSAPTDFMTEDNSYPVPYELTRVGADCQIYPPEGTWAEPDTAAAASLMRRVIEASAEAAQKGQRARLDIERLYAPAVTGGIARARLEAIAALWPARS